MQAVYKTSVDAGKYLIVLVTRIPFSIAKINFYFNIHSAVYFLHFVPYNQQLQANRHLHTFLYISVFICFYIKISGIYLRG